MIVGLYVQSLLCQEWEITEKNVQSVHTHFNMYLNGSTLVDDPYLLNANNKRFMT